MNNIYENKIIESDDHMARVLAYEVGFYYLPDALLNRERFYNGCDAARFYPKDDKDEACIIIGIKNFDTFITEQYIYSPEHFIQLIRKIMTHIKDTKRLEKYEQLIKKYESCIAENQTESE